MSMSDTGKNGAEDTLKRVGDMTSRAGKEAQKFADKLHLGARADKIAANVEQRAIKAYDSVKDRVLERPTLAVGVATGVGVMIGLLLARRG